MIKYDVRKSAQVSNQESTLHHAVCAATHWKIILLPEQSILRAEEATILCQWKWA